MKTLRLFPILLILISTALQSCGGKSDQIPSSSLNSGAGQSSNIETQLKKAKDKISSLEAENRDLQDSNRIVSDKLKELQDAAEKEARGVSPESATGSSASGISEQARIALMGAKAIAEFKAGQAERRVESLTSELAKKEDDLKASLENLEATSKENLQLKAQLETATNEADQKESELQQTIDKLESTLSERAATISKMEAQLKEKEDLLNTLKKAWSDATELKSSVESQLSQLNTKLTECQNQSNQAKTSLDQEKLETNRLGAELENLKKNLALCQTQSQALKAQAENYFQQIGDLKEKNSQLSKQIQESRPVGGPTQKPSSIIEKLLDGSSGEKSPK